LRLLYDEEEGKFHCCFYWRREVNDAAIGKREVRGSCWAVVEYMEERVDSCYCGR